VPNTFYINLAIWSQVASAILFIAVLVYFWQRFMLPAVLAAQERSNEQVAEAEQRRDDARAALDTLREQIEGANRDAEAIRNRAQRQAERERQAILAEATAAGERTVHNAYGEWDRARIAARERLRSELAARALRLAREGAEQRIDAIANAKLTSSFLSALEAERRASAS
jgi:F-type H+-transporting ATPase subunit b